MPTYSVVLIDKTLTVTAETADSAINQVLGEDMPIDALVGAYTDTLTPDVNARYGAPMGRISGPMDHDGTHKATRLTLDDGGYDAGGAYWGLRTAPNSLYAVEDGVGNIAYVDATTQDEAIQAALA